MDISRNQLQDFERSRNVFINNHDNKSAIQFASIANSFSPNVVGFGPHKGVNNSVKDNTHLHVLEKVNTKRSLTPFSRKIAEEMMTDSGFAAPVAVTTEGDLINTTGGHFPPRDLTPKTRHLFSNIPKKVVANYDPNFKFG